MTEVVGRATKVGWKQCAPGERSKFEVVIELDAPPTWPMSVVWDSVPVTLSIPNADERAAARRLKITSEISTQDECSAANSSYSGAQ